MATSTKGTLKYRKVQRVPVSGENAGKKMWYAAAVTDREMSFEALVSHIAEHTSPFSRGTVHGVLTDALDCLQELILDGKTVRLGELGLFSIGMKSRPEKTKADVSAQSVQDVHLIVRNTKTWSNAELAKRCRLEEYSTYDSTVEDTGGDTGGDGTDDTGGSSTSGGNTDTSGGSTDTSEAAPTPRAAVHPAAMTAQQYEISAP